MKPDKQELPPKRSHPVKSEDQASVTRDNGNMLSPQRNLIMESNPDPYQTTHNCTAAGSSNVNRVIHK